MPLSPPAFEDTTEAEAPLVPPAFEDTQEAEAPLSPPAFEDTQEIKQEKLVPQSISELSSRFLSSAAEGGLGAAAMLGRISPMAKLGDFIHEKTGLGMSSSDVITELEGAASRAKDDYGVNPKYDATFKSALASGAGSLLPIAASGGSAGAIAVGGLMGAEQGFQEATEAGETGIKRTAAAAITGATAALTEKLLGLPKMLKLVKESAKVPITTLKEGIKSVLKTGAKGSGLEGLQEATEQALNDLTAFGYYDPKREMFNAEKVLKAGAAGAIIGGGFGGILQTASLAQSPVKIAPKVEMQDVAQSVDESLVQIASEQPPVTEVPPTVTETPQGTPIISPEEMQDVPEGTPEELQASVPSEATEFVGTSINTPQGPVTGDAQGTAHPELMMSAMDKGAEVETLESNLGFAFKKPDGTIEWVDRVEAGRRLVEAGMLTGFKVGDKLTSEHIRNEVEGVTFNPNPNAVQEPKTTEVLRDVPQQREVSEEVPSPKSPERVPPSPQEAAVELQQYREQAIAAAKAAGATDPEAAASDAQREMAEKGITDPKQFIGTARNRGIDQQRSAKKTVPQEEAPEPTTQTGPRAEAVAKETASSIEEVISSMPEADQKVMRAYMESGGTDQEVATETGLTLDQVKKAKSRARQTLAQFVRSQGIGTRMAPGASNVRELRNARYLISTDIYQDLKDQGRTDRASWEEAMQREFPDTFDQEQLDQAWAITQEASTQFEESGRRKPLPKVIDQLTGGRTAEGQTSIKNRVTDEQRAARGLPKAMQAARRTHLSVWDKVMRDLEENPYLQTETLNKFRESDEVPTDEEVAILTHAQIEAENDFDEATDAINEAAKNGDQEGVLRNRSRQQQAATKLEDVLDINRRVGTSAGRALAARKMVSGRDYTLGRMMAELQASKGGEPLTEQEMEETSKRFDELQKTNTELQDRISKLEEDQARQAYDEAVEEMGTPEDPVTKSLVQRIVEKLNSAADRARQRILARLQKTSAGLDPTVLYDVAVIGASKIANGLTRKSKWRKAMMDDLADLPDLEENLDAAWDESNRLVDQAVEQVQPKSREKVKKILKNTAPEEVVDEMVLRMKNRVKEGDSVNDLRSYIQRMALALVRGGVTNPDGLLEAVYTNVHPIVPDLTKREVMDLISGYGDSRSLDPEKAKVQLRDIKGQLQQLAKLQDLQDTPPHLQKTGVERRVPSDAERRLIKQVNELKKKTGVVTTDPEKQLKSTLDSIRTRVQNEIKDLTHQIETGEKPVEGTPAPTSQEIENLKAVRSRLKEFIRNTEEVQKAGTFDEQVKAYEKEVKAIESALETSIKSYESQLNGEKKEGRKKTFTSEKIEALKAKRDSLRADVEAMKAADTDLKNSKDFDRLMKQADEVQARLDKGDVQPKTKAAKIEDDLVRQARDRLQALRDQMMNARRATPEFQQAQLDKAIQAVQKSIDAMDAKIKAGSVAPGTPGPKVTSPVLDRLRAERDAMSKLINELRKGPKLSREEVALKTLKARLEKANADLLDRIAKGDFSKRTKLDLDISKDAEAVRLSAENTKLKREFENAKLENERKTEGVKRKTLRIGKEILNVPRAVKSSLDLSAVLRQGGFLTFANPARAVGALKDMFHSFSQKGFENAQEALKLRKNYSEYQKSGLYLAELEGALSKREELFRSELADKIPGVKLSNRTYIAYLNRLRADSYDAMINGLTTSPTIEQKKAIAHFINVATGRGDLGVHGSAAETLSTVLWSPRLLISRIQLAAGEPLLRGNAKGVRTAIAKEYAKALSGVAVVMALGALMGADIEDDPRSSDFGKMRFGDTRIDPWMGLQQVTTFGTRIGGAGLESLGFDTPSMKTLGGKVYSLRKKEGETRGPFDKTTRDVASDFLQTKLTPLLGAGFELTAGEDVVGKPASLRNVAQELITPLSIGDIVPLMEDQGIPRGTAMQLLNLFGMSVQHHQKNP